MGAIDVILAKGDRYDYFTGHYNFYGLSENELGKKIRSKIMSFFATNLKPILEIIMFSQLHLTIFSNF